MKKATKIIALMSAVVGTAAIANAQTAPASGFFDWEAVSGATANTGFTPAPFLSDNPADIANVISVLGSTSGPKAIKVVHPITSTAAKNVFNQFKIDYVFCDFEDPANAVGLTRSVADVALNSTQSKTAFVGNFNYYPGSSADPTRPGTITAGPGSVSFSQGQKPQNFQYNDIRGNNGTQQGRTMANPSLYPGSPDFLTRGTSSLPTSGTPNMRSAFFTLPIVRAGITEQSLGSGDAHIPWVTRFNNWGNSALDTDGNAANGYQYVQNAANPANGQLLSRGDFQAQILHYRLRGADSVNLFQASLGSVVGYSRSQEASDIRTGWSNSTAVNGIMSRNNFAFANLKSLIGATGGNSGDSAPQEFLKAGAAWSGVYDKSGSSRRLAILLSNLSDTSKTIDLPNFVGGFHTISGGAVDDDYTLPAGTHLLLTFTLKQQATMGKNFTWVLDGSSYRFTDNNRNGVGIPEPTSIAAIGMAAAGLLGRRRRRA